MLDRGHRGRMAGLIEVCIVVAFCVASSLQSTQYTPCKDGPAPLDLRVSGCSKFPCPFYKGTNLTAEWDFIVTDDTESLRPRVKATVLGITVNYPLPEQNACRSLKNAECPLEKGEKVTYGLNMPIATSYPTIRLRVEFALIDQQDKPQVCFSVEGRVVNRAGYNQIE